MIEEKLHEVEAKIATSMKNLYCFRLWLSLRLLGAFTYGCYPGAFGARVQSKADYYCT